MRMRVPYYSNQRMSNELVTKAISYITGTIDLVNFPPNGFKPVPIVTVDDQNALLDTLQGGGRWKYLAIVGDGTHTIRVTLGQVTSEKVLLVHQGQTETQDFAFSDSE